LVTSAIGSSILHFRPPFTMLGHALITLVFLYAPSAVVGQLDFSAAHNLSSLSGTWSTGSGSVTTGAGFALPANMSFTYPKTAGESYSFTDDGYYEAARFRYVANATMPNCFTGVVLWTHGRYKFGAPNNSIILQALPDGYQQVQNPCQAISNFVEQYNQTETFSQWHIYLDPVAGPKLHLWREDGTPVAPAFQLSKKPNMLPQQLLRNVTAGPAPIKNTTDGSGLRQNSAPDIRWGGGIFVYTAIPLVSCLVMWSL